MREEADADLLGKLVGQGTAENLLAMSGGRLAPILAYARGNAFSLDSRVSEAQPIYRGTPYATLAAAWELMQRALLEEAAETDCLASPQAVEAYLRLRLRDLGHEIFMVIYLNAQNSVITTEEFRGTLTQVSVWPREIVRGVVKHSAHAIIVAHNHPSGEPTPSSADRLLTKALQDACGLVECKLCDHFIVAGKNMLSFAQRGLL
ncbi:MAG: DNA repair protein RadC [Betaproteobacteria bacterium]